MQAGGMSHDRPLAAELTSGDGLHSSLLGGVAQLAERYVRNVEAVGSNPITSTRLSHEDTHDRFDSAISQHSWDRQA